MNCRLALALPLLVAALSARPAMAQTCTNNCDYCGIEKYRSSAGSGTSYKVQSCGVRVFCSDCGGITLRTSRKTTPPRPGYIAGESILASLASGSSGALSAVVFRFRQRLLLNEKLGLLIVRGTRCNPETVTGVLRLSAEQVGLFQRARILTVATAAKAGAPAA